MIKLNIQNINSKKAKAEARDLVNDLMYTHNKIRIYEEIIGAIFEAYPDIRDEVAKDLTPFEKKIIEEDILLTYPPINDDRGL